jgi:signal transduction histidine kinase
LEANISSARAFDQGEEAVGESIEPRWEKGSPEDPQRRPDADGSRGGYLGFVAHEVRNPLSTALWTAELLARMTPEERGGARGEKLSAMCLRSLGRVRQLVEDHFLCERLDAGGMPMRPEPLAMHEVLEAVMARKPIDAAQLSAQLEPSLEIEADRGLAERVLESLIAAAGKGGGPVRLDARRDGDVIELRITGEPPAADALDDPRKGSASDQRGRALGLATARRATAALGGRLAVEEGAYVWTVSAAAEPPRP